MLEDMQALVNLPALSSLFPHGVARLAQLAALGPGVQHGQRLAPGVVMLDRSPPKRSQMLQAALLYAGPRAMITGMDALRLHGVTGAEPGPVHVLAPSSANARSDKTVHVIGASRLPEPVLREGFPCAPVARAAVDAARALGTVDRARALLGRLVRGGHTGIAELRAELGGSRVAGSGLARKALRDIAAGALTPAESRARELVRDSGLPTPKWSAALRHADGSFVAVVDAWWPGVGLAWEFGEAPRHNRELAAAGVHLVFTPSARVSDVAEDKAAVTTDLRHAYKHASRRTRPCRVSA